MRTADVCNAPDYAILRVCDFGVSRCVEGGCGHSTGSFRKMTPLEGGRGGWGASARVGRVWRALGGFGSFGNLSSLRAGGNANAEAQRR